MNTVRILFFVAAGLGVLFLWHKNATWRTSRSKEDVVRYLQSFLNGTEGPWDYDDFVSVSIQDPVLDSMRKRVLSVDTGDEYPPRTEAGKKIIQQLLNGLSTASSRNSGRSCE
jgi:hypothetical protein